MNKFNLPRRSLLKDRRAKRASIRRLKSGNASLKVPATCPQRPISGKQQRKQLKKWRRAQKKAIESGLVSFEDIEMMAVDSADGQSHLQEQQMMAVDNAGGQSHVEEQQRKPYKVKLKRKAKLMLKTSKKQVEGANLNEDTTMQ